MPSKDNTLITNTIFKTLNSIQSKSGYNKSCWGFLNKTTKKLSKQKHRCNYNKYCGYN